MADAESSFWTPARIAVVIGAVLLIVALAYLVSIAGEVIPIYAPFPNSLA